MNNFEIVIHPAAVTDIDDIASWYFVRLPQAELQFHHKLDAAISKLAKNPLAFGRIKKNSPS
ncbi:MAG: type II toxin-antitoxin system RelE/ParE family toxin [Chitinophagaceae bacterium]